jgi:hypothetical protein
MSQPLQIVSDDNPKTGGLLVTIICTSLFVILFGLCLSSRQDPLYFSDGEKVFFFLLGLGAVSGFVRLLSDSLGRVIFQGYCVFMVLALPAFPLWLWWSQSAPRTTVPYAIVCLPIALFFWKARSMDQESWIKNQNNSD